MTMTIDDMELVEQAGDIGRELGFEAAYLRGVSDPEECLEMYEDDYPDWTDEYGPMYAPLSGKSGGLTEQHLRKRLDLTNSTDGDLLDAVLDKFEEAFYEAWYDEILEMARLNTREAA